MSLTIRDVQSSVLSAKAQFEEYKDTAMKRFFAPIEATQLAVLYSTLPEEVRQSMDPKVRDDIEKIIKRYGG